MKKLKFLLIILLAVSLLLKVTNLNYPHKYYFDENYTAFTAVNLAQNNSPQIWQPSKTPIDPPRAFEWVHPPTARLIIATSINILGNNPWIWRLPSAIAGTLSILLIYLIGKSLLSEKVGLIAAYLLAFDGLSFAQSRIATTDSILVFFILLSIYLYKHHRLFLSAIAAGLALSTKWVAIMLLPLFLFQNYTFSNKHNRLQIKSIFTLGLLVVFIYLFSYLPFFFVGFNVTDFINLQKSMLTHSFSQNKIHPFQSLWFFWPIGYKPIPFYISNNKHLWAIPNYAVFWLGLVAIIAKIFSINTKQIKINFKKLKTTTFLLGGYFIFLLPWALLHLFTSNSRPTYFYYYLPSLPFLHLISANWISTLLSKKNKLQQTFAITILAVIPLIFLALYPRLVGL